MHLGHDVAAKLRVIFGFFGIIVLGNVVERLVAFYQARILAEVGVTTLGSIDVEMANFIHLLLS